MVLNEASIERMEGLSPSNLYETVKDTVEELRQDGFDDVEIKKYLQSSIQIRQSWTQRASWK